MTVREAKNSIFRKCLHCKYYASSVWECGVPLEETAFCSKHRNWTDGEEECCRSFDYANWIVDKTLRDNNKGDD